MPPDDDNSIEDATEEEAEQEQTEEGLRVRVERNDPCACTVTIEADADYLSERYQNDLSALQSEVTLPGFRRGRAPVGLVERRMGGTLKKDLVRSVLSEGYERAVEENDLKVVAEIDSPDLDELEWEPGQPLSFELKCEVMPEVEMDEGVYKGLAVTVPAFEMTDEMVQQEMRRFAERFATQEEVEPENVDWDDRVEGELHVPEVDWSGAVAFHPRDERIGPFKTEGIKAALMGARAGDRLELTGECAEEVDEALEELAPLAGRKVDIEFTFQRVLRRHVPEPDDELAREIGFESAAGIESMMRERLEDALADRKKQVTRDIVVGALVDRMECEMPPSLVDRAAREAEVRRLVQLLRAGLPRDQAEQMAAEDTLEGRETIVRRLKADYLLEKVAERERIIIIESEVDAQIRRFASAQGWREERARAYMEQRDMMRPLREDMRRDVTIEMLIESAQIAEIPAQEFERKFQQSEPGEGTEERDD